MSPKYTLPEWFCAAATVATAASVFLIFGFIFATAAPVLEKEGIGFLTGTEWNYYTHEYGILLYLASTLVLTAMTMVLAVPLGVLTAVFLAEWAPVWLDRTMSSMIELLIGIPSVIYGIFGLFILEGIFRDYIDPFISSTLGFIPIFYDTDPTRGSGLLLAATVLAIMILPTVTALSREAMRSVPDAYREGSLALGATRWETIRMIVLPAATSGILTGIILGLMRAMGETMAVVMVIGNVAQIPSSIYSLSYPMTSKILNDIGYHMASDEPRSALFAIGAILFLMEFAFVAAIRGVNRYYSRKGGHKV